MFSRLGHRCTAKAQGEQPRFRFFQPLGSCQIGEPEHGGGRDVFERAAAPDREGVVSEGSPPLVDRIARFGQGCVSPKSTKTLGGTSFDEARFFNRELDTTMDPMDLR